jgi:DNA modification methylase
MKAMPDSFVDVLLTSPPYNLGSTSTQGPVYADYKDSLKQEDYRKWISEVIKELIRVTRYYVFFNFQILTDNKRAYFQILNDFRENIKDIMIWHKTTAAPSNGALASCFEFVVVFCRPELASKRSFERHFFKPGEFMTNVVYGNNMGAEDLYVDRGSNHAAFPEYFARWFIRRFTQEGDIVLDPFVGTGTTVAVSKYLKRKYIGIDISQEYCGLSDRRLEQHALNDFGFISEKDEPAAKS